MLEIAAKWFLIENIIGIVGGLLAVVIAGIYVAWVILKEKHGTKK